MTIYVTTSDVVTLILFVISGGIAVYVLGLMLCISFVTKNTVAVHGLSPQKYSHMHIRKPSTPYTVRNSIHPLYNNKRLPKPHWISFA